jgi:hypothetical protein
VEKHPTTLAWAALVLSKHMLCHVVCLISDTRDRSIEKPRDWFLVTAFVVSEE